MENVKPSLVEPGVKYFIGSTLKQCRDFKNKYITLLFNISVLVVFAFAIGIFLYVRYKGKPTQADLEIKNRKKQEYIVSKLQQIALIKKQTSEKLISDLPNWSDHPELVNLRSRPVF